MERAEYVESWSASHGYDARLNPVALRWLAAVYAVARPLAVARVSPHVVTLLGVAAAAAAAALAALDVRWSVAAAMLVFLSGLLDGLDGALAVLRAKVTVLGGILDAAADRVSDLLFVTALFAAGAPGPLCAFGAALMFLHEYVRVHARAAGMNEVGIVTVAERPTRVIVTGTFLMAHGVSGQEIWPTLGAAALVAIGVVGLIQLVPVVRRALTPAR